LTGGLLEGAETTILTEGASVRAVRAAGKLKLDGITIDILWDEPMEGCGRPWFACPVCGRRCRHLYLRELIACHLPRKKCKLCILPLLSENA